MKSRRPTLYLLFFDAIANVTVDQAVAVRVGTREVPTLRLLRNTYQLKPDDVEAITIVGGTGGTQLLCAYSGPS